MCPYMSFLLGAIKVLIHQLGWPIFMPFTPKPVLNVVIGSIRKRKKVLVHTMALAKNLCLKVLYLYLGG